MRHKITTEYLPLFLESIQVGTITLVDISNNNTVSNSSTAISVARKGCPKRFRATSICYSNEKHYFEEVEMTILVQYEYGDRKDQFVLSGNSYGSQDTELNVKVAPIKDIDYRNGRCKYSLINHGMSIVLELLY